MYNQRQKIQEINMKFDLIVGNPPYQASNVSKGQKHLYVDFIRKSNAILNNDGGYLLLVSPPTFFKNNIDSISGLYLYYLNTDVSKYFNNIGTPICCYLLSNIYNNNVLIKNNKDEEFNIKLNNYYYLPIQICNEKSISIIRKILEFDDGWKMEFIRNQQPFPKNKAAFIRRMNRNITFNCLLTHKNFENEIKVNQDYTSEKNPDIIYMFLNSKLMSFFYIATQDTPFILKKHINSLVIPFGFNNNSNDADLYKHFNLTDNEIKLIEENV